MTTVGTCESASGTKTGRPMKLALDMLGRRTALRLLWELRSGSLTFKALLEACETNTGSLSTRLAEFKHAQLLEHTPSGYRLTKRGRVLQSALEPLSLCAQKVTQEIERP